MEMFVFGGEHEERTSEKVTFYNDLYRFPADKVRWPKISIPRRYDTSHGVLDVAFWSMLVWFCAVCSVCFTEWLPTV